MPAGSMPVHVEAQHDIPTIWFTVPDTDRPLREWRVALVGTGHPVPENAGRPLQYVGTSSHQGGHLILHVFAS